MPRRVNLNTHFFVTNIGHTSTRRCPKCVSWLDHWFVWTDSKRKTCAALGCANPVEVGAHVRTADRRMRREWYIIPLCRACNIHHNKDTFAIDKRVDLVPVRLCSTEGREIERLIPGVSIRDASRAYRDDRIARMALIIRQ